MFCIFVCSFLPFPLPWPFTPFDVVDLCLLDLFGFSSSTSIFIHVFKAPHISETGPLLSVTMVQNGQEGCNLQEHWALSSGGV